MQDLNIAVLTFAVAEAEVPRLVIRLGAHGGWKGCACAA
jgi:hypothetical protein